MGEFKEGDIVQLKSGGPKMTIGSKSFDGDYNCEWFAGGKIQYANFSPTSLVKVEEENE